MFKKNPSFNAKIKRKNLTEMIAKTVVNVNE